MEGFSRKSRVGNNNRVFKFDISDEEPPLAGIQSNKILKNHAKTIELKNIILEESTAASEYLFSSEDILRSRSESIIMEEKDGAHILEPRLGAHMAPPVSSATMDQEPKESDKDYAQRHNGSFVEEQYTRKLFKCQMRHIFDLSETAKASNTWCRICSLNLQNMKNYAESYGGSILNEKIEEVLTFRCKRGHEWSANFKNAMKKWCKECHLIGKKELKARMLEEARAREEEEKKNQNKMFEEAKRKMIAEQKKKKEEQSCQMQLCEEMVLKKALHFAKEYTQSSSYAGDVSEEQLLAIFKLLLYPNEALSLKFQRLDIDELKKMYRQLAVLVHPDKNRHPCAAAAFQKLQLIYSTVAKDKL